MDSLSSLYFCTTHPSSKKATAFCKADLWALSLETRAVSSWTFFSVPLLCVVFDLLLIRLLCSQRCSSGRFYASKSLRKHMFNGFLCDLYVLKVWFTQAYRLRLTLVLTFIGRKLATVAHSRHITTVALTQGRRQWRFSSRIYCRDQSSSEIPRPLPGKRKALR